MRICTSAQMQAIDRRTIREYGIPGVVLMERAGLAVCGVILHRKPLPEQVLVFAGAGNNGGDGFVVARELRSQGINVRVYLMADPAGLKGDALLNYRVIERLGMDIRRVRSAGNLKLASAGSGSIIVDAIFGTGLTREVKGLHLSVIRKINRSGVPVVAVDIPSGLSADTGRVLGEAVRAGETVSFGLPKRGHYLYPGPLYTGRLTVADIGFPGEAVSAEGIGLRTLDIEESSALLPERPPHGHKGSFGHLLVIAGSRGKAGAASLAAIAALKSGCGLVTIAVPEGQAASITRKYPEIMTLPLPENREGAISSGSISDIRGAASRASAVALGPGLSVCSDTMALVRDVLLKIPVPMLIDADAINCLMGDAEFLKRVKRRIVLTPHPAEFGRLVNLETVDVQSDRVSVAESFVRDNHHVLVLKGAHTLVAGSPEGVFMNMSGNSGMATAGSGDVLTGVAGALLAAGLAPYDAASAGVHIHGLAGDLAAEIHTERALTAGDIIRSLPAAFQAAERRRNGESG